MAFRDIVFVAGIAGGCFVLCFGGVFFMVVVLCLLGCVVCGCFFWSCCGLLCWGLVLFLWWFVLFRCSE